MGAFLYGALLQWKLDLRNRDVLVVYYIVPIVFFLFMGGVLSSINPDANESLVQSMVIFGVSMGAFLGSPATLITQYQPDLRRAYRAGHIPLWAPFVNAMISGVIHLFLMSLVILLIAPLAFGAKVPSPLPLYLLKSLLYILTCMSLGAILGLTIKRHGQATLFSQLLFLPSVMLSGIMLPLDFLPGFLRALSNVFPATWGYLLMTGAQTLGPLLYLGGVTLLALGVCLLRLKALKKAE